MPSGGLSRGIKWLTGSAVNRIPVFSCRLLPANNSNTVSIVDQLNPEVAKKIVESLLPGRKDRENCLRILAASIEQAHSISPGSWSLTITDKRVRLNVGRIEVLAIFQDLFHVVLQVAGGQTRYRWVNGSYTEDLPAADVGEKFPRIEASHRRLVSLATKTGRHSPWAFAHSLGALRYLEGVVGRSIAEPRKLHVHRFVLRRQFERFVSAVEKREANGEWRSFRTGLVDKWEGYKDRVRDEARRRLGFTEWNERTIGSGHILDGAIRAIEIEEGPQLRNNLVAWANRYGAAKQAHGALLRARSQPAERKVIEQWCYDFFRGKMANEDAFNRFCGIAGERYDLVAYLFFLKDWDRFMPIAPTSFDKAFALLDVPLVTTKACSWLNYSEYNEALLSVRRGLVEVAEIRDVRLIDAHSFCWMIARLGLSTEVPRQEIGPPGLLTGLTPHIVTPQREDDGRNAGKIKTGDEFAEMDAKRRRIGLIAQDVALQSERARLRQLGHPNPLVAQDVSDRPSLGYDIESSELDGTPRYIEVKAATLSGAVVSFVISKNEVRVSRGRPNYRLYLVFRADSGAPEVRDASPQEVTDAALTPLNYQVKLRLPGK